jgi:hypothetical protein
LKKTKEWEFNIVDSPHELKRILDEKNKEKKNSARLVAIGARKMIFRICMSFFHGYMRI